MALNAALLVALALMALLAICLAHPFAPTTSSVSIADEAFTSTLASISPTVSQAIAPVTTAFACDYLSTVLNSCEVASPGFSSYDASQQALCLCYESSTWIPDVLDGAILTCASYLYTADPTQYSTITGIEGFCSSVGSIPAIPTVSSSSTTTTVPEETSPPAGTGSTPTGTGSAPTSTGSAPHPGSGQGISDLTSAEKAGIGSGTGVAGVILLAGFWMLRRRLQGKPALRSSKSRAKSPGAQRDNAEVPGRAEKSFAVNGQSPSPHPS